MNTQEKRKCWFAERHQQNLLCVCLAVQTPWQIQLASITLT